MSVDFTCLLHFLLHIIKFEHANIARNAFTLSHLCIRLCLIFLHYNHLPCQWSTFPFVYTYSLSVLYFTFYLHSLANSYHLISIWSYFVFCLFFKHSFSFNRSSRCWARLYWCLCILQGQINTLHSINRCACRLPTQVIRYLSTETGIFCLHDCIFMLFQAMGNICLTKTMHAIYFSLVVVIYFRLIITFALAHKYTYTRTVSVICIEFHRQKSTQKFTEAKSVQPKVMHLTNTKNIFTQCFAIPFTIWTYFSFRSHRLNDEITGMWMNFVFFFVNFVCCTFHSFKFSFRAHSCIYFVQEFYWVFFFFVSRRE